MAPKYGQSGKGEQSKAKTFLVDDGPHGDAGLRHGVCHGGQLLLREVGKPGVCLQRLQMPSHVACVTRGRWDGHQGGGRALKYSGMSPRAPTEGLLLGIITPMISTGPLSPQKECQSVFVQAGTPQQHWVQLPHRCSPRANHRLQCRTRRGGHTVNRMRVSTARLG